jgi:hypothetical protein
VGEFRLQTNGPFQFFSLASAATMLHECFHLTGAGHGEDFFEKKPKPPTGYETIRDIYLSHFDGALMA